MKRARSFTALVLALCLCASLSACGDKQAASSEPADSGAPDGSVEETVQITEVSLEQLEGFVSKLWDMDIADADKAVASDLGINTDKKVFHDSIDDDNEDFWLVLSQTYTYDLTDSPTEVMGIPCREISIYAMYYKEEKDNEKPVGSITFEFSADSAEDDQAKLNSELTEAYGEGSEQKSFGKEFILWTPAGRSMDVVVYLPSEDSSGQDLGLALKFAHITE